MKKRILSLLVCLLVVIPPPVCTCAMVTVHCHDSHCHLLSPVAVDHDGLCECCKVHEHSAHDQAAVDAPAVPDTPHQHRHHDRDCPCLKIGAIRDCLKVASEVEVPPLAHASMDSVPNDDCARCQPTKHVVARASGPPLYLTLQVLLI